MEWAKTSFYIIRVVEYLGDIKVRFWYTKHKELIRGIEEE